MAWALSRVASAWSREACRSLVCFRGQHLPGLDHVPELHVAGLDVALALEGEGDALDGYEVAGGADSLLDVPAGRLGGGIPAALFMAVR